MPLTSELPGSRAVYPDRDLAVFTYARGLTTKKIVLIILDGVGCGELPDAPQYGDEGSNTLANMARAVGGLRLPNLAALGLGNIATIEGVQPAENPRAGYGRMAARSKGKDSTTGHWEIGGLVVEKEFPTFPGGFPPALMERFLKATGCRGYLGNTAASGTTIMQELGDEHRRTGLPIVYTSADSVFQIAAHEETIPLPQLYAICARTRDEVCIGASAVGRVIARPFVGTSGNYVRTTNRRDFSLAPTGTTVLDVLTDAGVPTISIGKVDDLFAGRGLSAMHHSRTNEEGISFILRESGKTSRGFIFANLVDFDALFGHRNDPAGFAAALGRFDAALPGIMTTIDPGDILILTADHGNDPVTPSTDHSREFVPLLVYSPAVTKGTALGTRSTFADIAKTTAEYFGISNDLAGTSFLSAVFPA